MNWQPIETAPRDGTRIDLWMKGERVPSAYWVEAERDWAIKETDHDCGETYDRFLWAQPTHWMPIPPPPTEQTSDSNRPHLETGAGRSAKRE